MYRLLAIDLDGTLLSPEKLITPRTYDLLCQIKDYFGVGKITKHGDSTLQYMVRSLKDLNIIL